MWLHAVKVNKSKTWIYVAHVVLTLKENSNAQYFLQTNEEAQALSGHGENMQRPIIFRCYHAWTRQQTLFKIRVTNVGLCIVFLQSALYTVFHKKTSASCSDHFSLKCIPILIILSLLHSQMNCRKICNKVYHRTLNPLPHYLVKNECSTVQLYSALFNVSVMQNR